MYKRRRTWYNLLQGQVLIKISNKKPISFVLASSENLKMRQFTYQILPRPPQSRSSYVFVPGSWIYYWGRIIISILVIYARFLLFSQEFEKFSGHILHWKLFQKMNAFGKFNNNSTKKKTEESLSVEYRFFVEWLHVLIAIYLFTHVCKRKSYVTMENFS